MSYTADCLHNAESSTIFEDWSKDKDNDLKSKYKDNDLKSKDKNF